MTTYEKAFDGMVKVGLDATPPLSKAVVTRSMLPVQLPLLKRVNVTVPPAGVGIGAGPLPAMLAWSTMTVPTGTSEFVTLIPPLRTAVVTVHSRLITVSGSQTLGPAAL